MDPDLLEGLLVLRFRDLGVERGETILFHRRAIAAHGSCWWGWWGRSYELRALPVVESLRLPRSVALYDTDQGRIYRATCEEVVCSAELSLSPDVSRTPSYYNNKRLPAWFRFVDIESEQPDWVGGRRCLYMPIERPDLGWFVGGLEELRMRSAQVTLWVLSGGDVI